MKRYTLREDEDTDGNLVIIGMDDDPEGEWVRFEDAERVELDWHNACDVGQRLEARNKQLGDELGRSELTIAKLEDDVRRLRGLLGERVNHGE